MTGRQSDGETGRQNKDVVSPSRPVAPSPRLFYLNALFDLELGGHPVESVRAGALEMGPLFSFCGTKHDRLLLDVQVPDEFWDYLDSLAIPYAPLLNDNDNPSDFSGTAWGWNDKSIDRFSSLGVHCRHPDLQVVKKVNNRSFCASFNTANRTGVPGTRFCASMDEVRKAAGDLKNRFPLVAKPAFGGAGFGFAVINNPDAIEGISSDGTRKLLLRHGCTIEPWCDRLHDVSSSCTIGNEGSIANLRHYRCFTNKHGSFYGVALGGATDPVIRKYRHDLDNTAALAVNALKNAGYTGPVSFDSFVYRDAISGNEKLAAIIEINGRYIMSTIAHALYSAIGRDRSCCFRFLGRKRCSLPETYGECGSIIGKDRYDPQERKGIILLTPLRVAHGKIGVRPVRSAFFIVGLNSNEVMAMDERLKGLFPP
jgi:hypothetical protein